MQIEILERFHTIGVPRDTPAPWLSKRSRKWKLTTELVLKIDGRVYRVPVGYVFDGSTIPRVLWLIWTPANHDAWVASCFHDYCYSHLYKEVDKKWADVVFREIMVHEGSARWKAQAFYLGTRVGGRGGWYD